MSIGAPPPGFQEVLFIETGCGTDQHGQSVTKACVRAIKDAISWNSIPSLERLVPGGNGGVKLHLQLAVPFEADGKKPPHIDMEEIEACFAYGRLHEVEVMQGGARFDSMCNVEALGDSPSDGSWVVVNCAVTVGY